MTWITPTDFDVGEAVTSALMNQLAVDINAFLFQSCIFDEVGGSQTGVGTGYTGIRAKLGTITNATPSGGVVSVAFAAAFPNNVWTAWISPIGTGGANAQWQVSSTTASGFNVMSWTVGTNTPTSASVSFYWMALGA
jgi:hypothetical protein